MRPLFLLGLCGCNAVFGLDPTKAEQQTPTPDADMRPDLDNDGIRDPDDLCVASPTDTTGDADVDGVPNAMDPCPFDVRTGMDPDTDGVGACDPFPSIAGDRMRCAMTFRNVDLNNALWMPRTDAWSTAGSLIPPDGDTSIIIRASHEAAAATTYELHVAHTNDTIPVPSSTSVTMIVRTGTDPTRDVGCRVTRSTGQGVLSVVGGSQVATGAQTPNIMTISATIAAAAGASAPTVRCAAVISAGTGPDASVGPIVEYVPLPAGLAGISARTTQGSVQGSVGYQVFGLVIYDRVSDPLFPNL